MNGVRIRSPPALETNDKKKGLMPKSLEIVTAAGVLNNITGALAMSPNALTIETVRSGKQAMKQRLS